MLKIIKGAEQILTIKDNGFPRHGKNMSELDILTDCSVIIEDEYIIDVINTQEGEKKYTNCEIIDATGCILMPGICDSHTHLVWAGSREDEFALRAKGASYMEIMNSGGGIQNTVNATRNISFEKLLEISQKRLKDVFRYGTTSIEIKSGYGLDFDTEIKQLEVAKSLKKINPEIKTTFMGAHAKPPKFHNNEEYLDFLEKKVLPEVAKRKLADFIDIFCEKGVFTPQQAINHLNEGKKYGLIPKIHADELEYSGACEVASIVGAISADHLLKASDNAIYNMKKNNVIATLLPATLFNLKSKDYQRARFIIDKADVPVALATDFNPGSCYCENIFVTMHIACQYNGMFAEEVIIASTLNGAYAMGLNKKCGSIQKGKLADILIIDAPSYKFIPYHFGINPVKKTIKRGNIVSEKTCYH